MQRRKPMKGSHLPPDQSTFRKIGVQLWRKVDVAGYTPPVFGNGRVKVGVDQSAVSVSRCKQVCTLLCRVLTRVYPVVTFTQQVNPYEWVVTVENNGYLHEYGPELTGGKVSMDHSSFTTTASIHGGRKATKKYKSVALLDSGSPSSFVTQAVIDEMLRKGAASADMVTVGKPRRWGGFTESTEPLQTNSSSCLSVQLF